MGSSVEPDKQPVTESRITADSDKWEPNLKAALEAVEEGRMSYGQARDAHGINISDHPGQTQQRRQTSA